MAFFVVAAVVATPPSPADSSLFVWCEIVSLIRAPSSSLCAQKPRLISTTITHTTVSHSFFFFINNAHTNISL